jgi:hypothetical protein
MHGCHLQKLLSRPCGRRATLRWATALAAVGTAGAFQSAISARGWCRSDPLVRIDGELVYIVFAAPRTIRKVVTGPTEVVITVPLGVQTALVAAGSGFGEGETVRFVQSRETIESRSDFDILVETRVPASEDLPIGLEVARRTRGNHKQPARANGQTNRWIALSTKLSDA